MRRARWRIHAKSVPAIDVPAIRRQRPSPGRSSLNASGGTPAETSSMNSPRRAHTSALSVATTNGRSPTIVDAARARGRARRAATGLGDPLQVLVAQHLAREAAAALRRARAARDRAAAAARRASRPCPRRARSPETARSRRATSARARCTRRARPRAPSSRCHSSRRNDANARSSASIFARRTSGVRDARRLSRALDGARAIPRPSSARAPPARAKSSTVVDARCRSDRSPSPTPPSTATIRPAPSSRAAAASADRTRRRASQTLSGSRSASSPIPQLLADARGKQRQDDARVPRHYGAASARDRQHARDGLAKDLRARAAG